MPCCINHSTGLQWVHQDFTAKKNQKGKKAKAVVNMSLGGVPGQVGTVDEVHSHKYLNQTILCKNTENSKVTRIKLCTVNTA